MYKIFNWFQRKLRERKDVILDEEIIRQSPPLWKVAGYTDSKEMEQYTIQIYWFEPDNFYMATKCKDQTWLVWENLGNNYSRNHIHFFNWQEAVLFLFEESQRLNALWDPMGFGFRPGMDPFKYEPDLSFYDEIANKDYC